MAKRRPTFNMYSYGEYSKWDRSSREIPKIMEFKTEIEAQIGTEFGYVLHIKNGKGETVVFQIDSHWTLDPVFRMLLFLRILQFRKNYLIQHGNECEDYTGSDGTNFHCTNVRD